MSYTFTDLEGKKWDLKITLATARRIEASNYDAVTKIQFAFLQPEQDLFSEVFSNVQFAMALAWTVVQPQVPANYDIAPEELDQAGIASESELRFVEAMDGNILQQAKQALMESLADFFPEQRTVLLTLQNKIKKARKLLEMEFQNVDGELDKMMEEEIRQGTLDALEKMRGVTYTKPSEQLGTTPEISQILHSESS